MRYTRGELAETHKALHVRTLVMLQRRFRLHGLCELCPEAMYLFHAGHVAVAPELFRVSGGVL